MIETAIIIGTILWIGALIALRHVRCEHFRKPENDRRQEQLDFDGPDARRCVKCPLRSECEYGHGCVIDQKIHQPKA